MKKLAVRSNQGRLQPVRVTRVKCAWDLKKASLKELEISHLKGRKQTSLEEESHTDALDVILGLSVDIVVVCGGGCVFHGGDKYMSGSREKRDWKMKLFGKTDENDKGYGSEGRRVSHLAGYHPSCPGCRLPDSLLPRPSDSWLSFRILHTTFLSLEVLDYLVNQIWVS